ncbi:hypothetical protein [Acetobacter orientalis]
MFVCHDVHDASGVRIPHGPSADRSAGPDVGRSRPLGVDRHRRQVE